MIKQANYIAEPDKRYPFFRRILWPFFVVLFVSISNSSAVGSQTRVKPPFVACGSKIWQQNGKFRTLSGLPARTTCLGPPRIEPDLALRSSNLCLPASSDSEWLSFARLRVELWVVHASLARTYTLRIPSRRNLSQRCLPLLHCSASAVCEIFFGFIALWTCEWSKFNNFGVIQCS